MSDPNGCPSCDRDLSYPGAPGHQCYTYDEWRANVAAHKAKIEALNAAKREANK